MYKYFLLSSTFMLLTFGIANASDNNFEVNLGTHTHLPQLELSSPSLNPDGSYKTARVCSLANENCEDDFGFNKSDKELNSGAKKCKKDGYTFTKTNCTGDKILEGKCKWHAEYYSKCTCPSSYQYNSSNCNNSQMVAGNSCSDHNGTKYNQCICKPAVSAGTGEICTQTCASNSSVCTAKGCKAAVSMTYPNDYCTQKCASNSSICTAKSCSASCPSGSSTSCGGAYTGTNGCGSSCYRCCDDNCPSGYSKSYPGGCYDSSSTGCGTSCYRSKTCCTPYCSSDWSSCAYGETYSNDGCGGSCRSCKPKPNYWNFYVRVNHDGWCYQERAGYVVFVYTVNLTCENEVTGQRNTIVKTASCYRNGSQSFKTVDECKKGGTYQGDSYQGKCNDTGTVTATGRTSADNGRCVL